MKKVLHLIAAASLFLLFGCSGDQTIDSGGPANPNPFTPKGTVTGILADVVTNAPIANADVYIMDRHAVTGAQGQFTITDVPANTAVGNEPANAGSDTYNLVIDLVNVNAAIKAYNDNPANTVKKAFYPAIAYSTADVKYDSLGDSAPGTTGSTNATNHDTPVNGFVASIKPLVGKLDATIKIQVIDDNLQPVEGATVLLGSTGRHVEIEPGVAVPGSPDSAVGNVGNVVASATTDAQGMVTFSDVEALSVFVAYAVSSDGRSTGNIGVISPSDNVTISYLNHQDSYTTDPAHPSVLNNDGKNDALQLKASDTVAPFVTSTTPANLADIAPGATSVVFTFSEPIKNTAYALATTAATSANGGLFRDVLVNYLGPKAGNMAYTLSWNTAMTQLTVTLTTSGTSRYTVSIDGAVGKLVDTANNALVAGDFTTVTFSTSGGLAVAAPAITRNVNGGGIPTSSISWLPVANALNYRVYVERVIGGVGSGYLNAGEPSVTTFNLATSALFAAGGAFSDRGFVFSTGQTIITYNVKVVTLNTEGTESAASNVVVIDDKTAPTVALFSGKPTPGTVPASGATGSSFNGTMNVTFSEQMDEATVINTANWTAAFQNGATVVSGLSFTISSITYNPATLVATVNWTVANTTAAPVTFTNTVVTAAVKDLNGNTLNPNTF